MELKMINLKKNKDCGVCNADKAKPLYEGYKDDKCDKLDSISPKSLAKLINIKGDIDILDVREPFEIKICKIENSMNIPLSELKKRLDRLDKDKKLIVYCHHGSRSRIACDILNENGFNAINLEGGIDNWARVIQPDMKRY